MDLFVSLDVHMYQCAYHCVHVYAYVSFHDCAYGHTLVPQGPAVGDLRLEFAQYPLETDSLSVFVCIFAQLACTHVQGTLNESYHVATKIARADCFSFASVSSQLQTSRQCLDSAAESKREGI